MYHDAYQVYELLDKWNPLGPPKVDQVEDLFQRDPSAALQEFLFGQTLLHKCMEYYSNRLDLVRLFLEAHPKSVTKTDDNGFLPIHRALISATGEPTLALIQLLFDAAPETILQTTPNGALPLHLACARFDNEISSQSSAKDATNSTTATIVKYLVDCFPESIQHRDNEGWFPLQHALEAPRPQPTVVEILLKHYPVLLSFLDEDGYLPLHRILQKGRARYNAIVDLLVAYCPGALRFQELQYGQTPLALACQNNNSVSQIYSLVHSWPEQVSLGMATPSSIFETEQFNGEMLPSALASQSANVERLKAWVDLYPGVVSTSDMLGRLPLHYAALSKSEKALEMVQFLLECDCKEPGASCGAADHHGRLPLHYAAAAANGEIVALLINTFRGGLIQFDNDGRLPWHYAECSRLDAVYEQTLEYVQGDDERLGDLDLVPDEIRWDVIQIVHDEW